MKQNLKWGIDLGGTKIEGVVLNEQHEVLLRKRIPTEREKGYEHILQRIGSLVDDMEAEIGYSPRSVGVGTPGSLDPTTGLLKNSNTVCLNGMPFWADIEAVLDCNVKIANDANCFAVAETVLGCVAEKAPAAEVVFGVILGTGVGGGIVINGKVINGAQGIAGEWGHMFLDHVGGHCYCGRVGCVESIIAGPALERYYTGIAGVKRSMQSITARYEQKEDVAAEATLNRFFHFFAKGIANVINVLDPDVIVVGGGLGQIDALYEIGLPYVGKHVFNSTVKTTFLRPKLGDSAGVFGAALL